jgi:hypothetical protein
VILRTNHLTIILITISCPRWIAFELRIYYFFKCVSNSLNGSNVQTLFRNHARNPTATRTQNRTRIRLRFGALKPKESKNYISPSFALFTFISDVADNSSQHAHPCFKHYSSSGQLSLWANVFRGKRLFGQISSGQMSFWANVFLGKHLLGKPLMGKCPSGQMSFWANVFWADVFWANVVLGQMSLGKCLWANVLLTNVVSPSWTGRLHWTSESTNTMCMCLGGTAVSGN